jgi:membrane protein
LRLTDVWSRLSRVYQKEIWQSAFMKDRSPRGLFYAVLRVVSITLTVCDETRIVIRAAALSYSSLLGLGPLLAIAVLVAGFALGKTDSTSIAKTLDNMLKVVAPQLAEYEAIEKKNAAARASAPPETDPVRDAPPAGATRPGAGSTTPASATPAPATSPTLPPSLVSPTLVDTIDGIIKASQSGSVGALGVFSLLFVVLLMFKGIEDTFNDIWGVHQGRSVLMRIVLYWTVLTLGALLFFTAVALLGASTFASVFQEKLKAHGWFSSFNWSLPSSFALLALMLTLFYRVIPNTRVLWRSALLGALVVTALLALNNFVAFVYVKRVILQKSLYGSLALPLVLLSVLYIFWLCVLIGGTVSYAVQNVHFRNSQAAWSTLTESMRERLALVVFLTICRRFRECLPPISASHLSTMLKVPAQLLNECLSRLVALKLVTTLRPDPNVTTTDYLYQPARPLNKLTLFDFKTLDDNYGENPVSASLEHIEPLIVQYDAALARLGEQEFFQLTLEQLLETHPFDESRPPFAMGDRPSKK